MAKEGICENCYSDGMVELHHIIPKGEIKCLRDCKLNFVYLCYTCHRDNKKGAHACGELDKRLRLKFQNKLEMLFVKEEFTLEEISKLLGINYNASYSLSKLMKSNKGVFTREEIIRACMGREIINSEDIENE